MKETSPSKYNKKRGITISLTQIVKLKDIPYSTRGGLYKLFNNPNDIDHKQYNEVVDKAQSILDEIT
jgi:hypothetical protein